MKISILYKGSSSERQISEISGRQIEIACSSLGYKVQMVNPAKFSPSELIDLLKKQKSDVVVNALHGGAGENGQLQTLLELAQIPFTGSPSKASTISMDKKFSTALVKQIGLPTAKSISLKKGEKIKTSTIEKRVGLPLVVKPNCGGSSLGISIVQDRANLQNAIKTAFEFDEEILCEKYIKGREITATILSGQALPVVEVCPKNGFYDFTNKYTKGSTDYIVPAKLSKKQTKKVQKYAERIFCFFGCRGYARIDFRFDGEDFYFLETNTLPGMTPLSLTPMAAKAQGMSFTQLIETIIKQSL